MILVNKIISQLRVETANLIKIYFSAKKYAKKFIFT